MSCGILTRASKQKRELNGGTTTSKREGVLNNILSHDLWPETNDHPGLQSVHLANKHEPKLFQKNLVARYVQTNCYMFNCRFLKSLPSRSAVGNHFTRHWDGLGATARPFGPGPGRRINFVQHQPPQFMDCWPKKPLSSLNTKQNFARKSATKSPTTTGF